MFEHVQLTVFPTLKGSQSPYEIGLVVSISTSGYTLLIQGGGEVQGKRWINFKGGQNQSLMGLKVVNVLIISY